MEWEVSKGITDTSEIKDGRFSLKTFCGDSTMCECVLATSATSSLMGYCFVTNRAIARVKDALSESIAPLAFTFSGILHC